MDKDTQEIESLKKEEEEKNKNSIIRPVIYTAAFLTFGILGIFGVGIVDLLVSS